MKTKSLVGRKSRLLVFDELSDDYINQLSDRFNISKSRAVRIAIQYSFLTSQFYQSYMAPKANNTKFEEIKAIPLMPGETERQYIERIIMIAATPINYREE